MMNRQNGFTVISLLGGIFIAAVLIGAGYYLGISKNPTIPALKQNSIETPLTETIQNTKPTIADTIDKPIAQQSPNPSPTTASTAKTIKYNLPQGWQTIKSTEGNFEASFDPNKFTAQAIKDTIVINYKSGVGGYAYWIGIKPYNGGSRHQFIYNITGSDNIVYERTYEKNYLVNGKSALILYNVDASATSTLGMLAIDNSRAFVIDSSATNEILTEQLLGTLKAY